MLWLSGELFCNGALQIASTSIFGPAPSLSSLSISDPRPPYPTISPPFPFGVHPQSHVAEQFGKLPWYGNSGTFKIKEVPTKYLLKSLTDGSEWGAFVELSGDQATVQSLPFYVDIFKNMVALMTPGQPPSWYPTITLSIEFKFPIPADPLRQLAIFSNGRVAVEGRADHSVELWAVPAEVDVDGEEWKKKCFCLAIGRQISLTRVPERNWGGSKI
ncbi:hypothetical protein BT69DRAFT_1336209 [Atractiella rhizophila]|nr:hypothetical protein BT69DRAFT_1336209 [Atractiella rhizophila]